MSELIKTPVRYFADYILVDATGRSVCTFFDYAGVDNPRVREYIALCINDHERLVAEVERLKADVERLTKETDRLANATDKWCAMFTYTAEILEVKPTMTAVENEINRLKADLAKAVWVEIKDADDLPAVEGQYLWLYRHGAKHYRSLTATVQYYDPQGPAGAWAVAQYSHWQKISYVVDDVATS